MNRLLMSGGNLSLPYRMSSTNNSFERLQMSLAGKNFVDTIEHLASLFFIRLAKQQEMFCVLNTIICRTHWVYCISKIMPKLVKIQFAETTS